MDSAQDVVTSFT